MYYALFGTLALLAVAYFIYRKYTTLVESNGEKEVQIENLVEANKKLGEEILARDAYEEELEAQIVFNLGLGATIDHLNGVFDERETN